MARDAVLRGVKAFEMGEVEDLRLGVSDLATLCPHPCHDRIHHQVALQGVGKCLLVQAGIGQAGVKTVFVRVLAADLADRIADGVRRETDALRFAAAQDDFLDFGILVRNPFGVRTLAVGEAAAVLAVQRQCGLQCVVGLDAHAAGSSSSASVSLRRLTGLGSGSSEVSGIQSM
ncbi:hypothetical protein SDC9_164560 [bioreactor metagenome]|uniref:Uncharacterized protein n=1 Tax=bioreactor metagenome TaxID=1076179 RepID=A0A645FTG3_9ZZZZ